MRLLGHAFVLGLVAASIHAGEARADTWPIGRHDASRTGASSAVVPIDDPYVTWQAYMGGHPTAYTLAFDQNNGSTFLASVGGRFMLKDAMTQATLWKSDMLGVGDVEGMADLNGDGQLEMIVRSETRAYVLDQQTGAVLWGSAPDAFRTPAAVRVTDLDGDKLPDVYVDECTTCAKQGLMSAGAYSFANGFSLPKMLWERPLNSTPAPLNSGTDAIVDLDDDGMAEVVLTSADKILVVRGSDGTTIATLSLPTADKRPFPHARAVAAEIDGLPGKELVIVQPTGQVAIDAGPAGITVFKLDPQTGANSLLYRHVAKSFDEGMIVQTDAIADLDDDGISEIIFSHRGASQQVYTTEILSGPTGNSIVSLNGARFEGAANLDDTPGAEIVLATQNGLSIHGFALGQLTTLAGPIPDVRVEKMPDEFGRRTGQLDFRAGVLPRPGRRPALLVGKPSSQIPYANLADVGNFLDIRGLTLMAGGTFASGTYVPLQGEITGVVPAADATRPYPQIAVGTTAGTVVLLSQSFQGTNGIVYAGGQASGSIVGGAMQPNTGARGGPLVGADNRGPFVVLPDSPEGLFVGNPQGASLIVPPSARWTAARMVTPSIIELGSLGMTVVGADGHSLVARTASNGAIVGEVDLGLGSPHGTPLPLHVAGVNTPFVGIDWRVEGVQVVQHTVDFLHKSEVWQGAPLPYGGFFASNVADLDKDGNDEWYSMNDGLNRRDAATGATSTLAGEGMGYSLPMAASFSAGGSPELLLQGGALAPRLLDANLKQVWQSPTMEPVNGMGGARVTCGSAVRFVSPSVLSPMLRSFDGATGTLIAERALAGGVAYPSVSAALAAGANPGVLSNASSVAQLGNGNGAILVGSSDGYLYALDACTLAVRWAEFLGGSVSEPIVGNTDNDVGDEIVVSVASGYIVNIDIPHLSPTQISFVGPKNGQAPTVVSPGESVKISFTAVEGAEKYEYALVGPENQALWSPPYREVTGNQVTVSLEGALAARPYRIAVRAKDAEGASPDAFSETITIDDRNAPSLKAGVQAEGKSIAFNMTMHDDVALDHWIVSMQEAYAKDGHPIVAGEDLVGGQDASVNAPIVAPAELWGKNVDVRVDLVDSAGNSTSAIFHAQVDNKGQIVAASQDTSAFAKESLSFGGCNAAGNGSTNTGAAVFIGLALSLLRRARRRTN